MPILRHVFNPCLIDTKLGVGIGLAPHTKLPFSDDYEIVLETLFHWLQCLTDIRRAIADGAWRVHLEDTDATWDDEAGWHMR